MNRNASSILKIALFALLALVIVVYSLFQAQKIINGPIIDISSPKDGATYTSPLIEVQGKAENVAYLSLDGRQIFTDKDGNFKENLLLAPGLNVIQLDGIDKFKSKTKKTIQVVLKEY